MGHCEINPSEFWLMTLSEVFTLIDAKKEQADKIESMKTGPSGLTKDDLAELSAMLDEAEDTVTHGPT